MIGPNRKHELVQEAADGSELALTLLLKDSHSRLCDYVARKMPRILKATFEPVDIVQDTQVEAYRLSARSRPRAKTLSTAGSTPSRSASCATPSNIIAGPSAAADGPWRH